MANKYVTDTKAGKSLSAYIVLNKKGEHIATVRAHYSDSGVCLVNVHDDKAGFQHATAGGYGYDKFTAALSGMTIDGHKMSNHCSTEKAPKPPKGRVTFPHGFKVPKGYSLANWISVSKATKQKIYGFDWQDKARAELGFPDREQRGQVKLTDAQWQTVAEKAHEMEQAWRASDDCESGWMSCHRLSGLDYLKARGYRVIQAI